MHHFCAGLRIASSVPSYLFALTLLLASHFASAQSAEPILTFDQTHPFLSPSANPPLVQVFANGRIVVNRPAGMRNPGQYELTVSSTELRELLQLAQSPEVVNFDEGLADEANEENGTLFDSSEPTTSIFRFQRTPNSNLLADEGNETISDSHIIELEDVKSTAANDPGIPGIKRMEALHKLLISFVDRAGA